MTNAEIAEILAQALRLPSSERAAFLHEACGDDTALLTRIHRMLKAFEESGAFPADEHGAVRAVETALRSPKGLEGPGSKIGPYKVLQLIGEGGFGLVYMAEQHEPIRRKVALKIIKPGMDTREVIARFEAERQALALMDHPNIARVLDAGTVDRGQRNDGGGARAPAGQWGRPYFVMELVRGVPLTEYCDKNLLSTRERLSLFAKICQAVQHAHQKGIIHRDLKPSNILVTLHDGQPVPKVIDFGVAKALNQQLTEKTLFTAYGQMVGTPQYMSPEQAEMSGLDVDTRSDIYSLGVLLYELLTGTTPLDSQRLRSAGFAEMQRLIREEEPPRPSTRVSTLGEGATSVAQHRSVDPRRLRQELRGELDWIVMKALEKDRNRRYVSASGFVEDIQRYLRDEPVLACPPSAAYRFEKFARRNKVLLATLAAVALVLVVGAALSAMMASRAMRAERLAREQLTGEIQARHDAETAQAAETEQRRVAERERDRADAARQQALAELEHAQVAQRQAEANFQQARATVDQYLTTVSESQLLTVPGMQPLRQAMLDAALAFYERFVAERPQDPQLRAGLAAAYARLGRVASDLQQREQGREYFGKAEQLYEALMQEANASPEVERGLAEVYFWRQRTSEAISLCQRRLREDPQDHAARDLLADAINALAVGDDDDAQSPRYVLRLHRQAFAHRAALVAAEPDNPEFLRNLGGTINNVGVVLARRGRERDALFQYRRGVELSELAFSAARYSVQHGRFLAIGRGNEAGYLARLGFVDAAIAARRRVAEVWLRLAQENPALPSLRAEASSAYRELAKVQRQFGREDEAAQTVLASRQLIENLPQETADDVYNLAVIYATLARSATRTPAADASPGTADLREALRTLARAVALGFRNRATIEKEAAFTPLKDRPEFTELLALLELRQRIDAAIKATDPTKLPEVLALRDELQTLAHEHSASLLLAETHRTVGDYLMRVDQLALAQRNLDQALKLMPADAEDDDDGRTASALAVVLETARTWQTLGQLHFRAQRYTDAMAAWQSARTRLVRSVQKRPDDAQVKQAVAALEYELAEAYGTLGVFDGARDHYERGFAAAPAKDSLVAVQHAMTLADQDNPEAHRRVVNWMRTNFPDTDVWGTMRTALAGCLRADSPGSGRSALGPMNAILQIAPDDAWARLGLGLAHLRGGAPDAALDTLSTYEPSYWIAGPYYQALACRAANDIERARELFGWGETQYRQRLTSAILVDTDAALHSALWVIRRGDSTNPTCAWYDVRVAQLARAEASAAIDGQPRPDPWKHLLAARGFALLGDRERAAAEFAAAEQAGGDDPEMWITRGRVHARIGDLASAERAFQRAIDLQPQNATTWIARGRYWVEQGAMERADADFRHAAELTPDELHRFLEAGWWVLGPGDETAVIDHSLQFDVEQLHLLPPATLDNNGTSPSATWHLRVPDIRGIFSLPADPKLARRTAATYVYSPDERVTTVLVGGTVSLSLSVNGQHVHTTDWTNVFWGRADCIPITLQPGRNTFVVESESNDPSALIWVRMGDSLVERAIQLAQLGIWEESIPVWEECYRRDPLDSKFFANLVHARFLAGADNLKSIEVTNRYVWLAQSRLRDPGPFAEALRGANLYVHAATFDPDFLRQAQAACVHHSIDQWWHYATLGMTLYRAGRFAEQVEWLKPYESRSDLPHVLVWSALGHFQLGKHDHARRLLEMADARFRSELDQAHSRGSHQYVRGGWEKTNLFVAWRREASLTMTSGDDPFEAMIASFTAEGRRELTRRTPELAAYDETIARHGREPRAWRARARRLMQLARWDEAAHDLEQAVSLDANDVPTSIAYAEYWLGRGDVPQAATYALRAASGAAGDPSEMTRQEWVALLERFDDDTLAALDLSIQSQLLLAQARHHAGAANRETVRQNLDRALEADATNADALIARGRWHAELGDHAQADADFARAVSLMGPVAPEGSGQGEGLELNRFLEAGWWVVGPYPAELREFCPPEVAPDPSRPVPTIDPRSGISDQPSPWVSVPTGPYGLVNVSAVPGSQPGATVYALSYVWAPQACSTTLLVHRDQALRLWINQELIENDLPGDYATSWYEPFHRVPIDLVAGRNTILVKVASTADTFTARLGDSPRDRTVLLAEQKRFSEAVQAMGDPRISMADMCRAQARPDIGDGGQSRIFDANLPRLWALDEATRSLFEQACADFASRSDPTLHHKGVIPSLCATRPNPVFDQHRQQYVSYIEEHATAVNQPWAFAFAAFVNYRAGNFDRVRELIGSHQDWPSALMQTLLAHSTGDSPQAAEWFAKSLAIGTEYADRLRACDRSNRPQQQPFAQWADWALYLIVLEEAEQLVRGERTATAALRSDVEAQMAERWSSSPDTVPYDHAIFLAKRRGQDQLQSPRPLLARGQRLSELGRFDEALADFDKAVALAPDDWQVQLARAAFLADRGDWEASANVFRPLLAQTGGDRWWLDGRRVEEEIVAREPLLDYLQSIEPNAGIGWRLRGCRRTREQRWAEAATEFTSGDPYWSHFSLAAMLHLLLGDHAAYDRCTQEMERLIDEQLGTNPLNSVHRCFLRTLHLADGAAARDVLALARESLRENPQSRDARLNLALAHYRAGQYDAALRWAQQSLAVPCWWQEHVPAWPVLAMCHWQLGNQDEAQQWLSQTAWWIEFARHAADRPEAIGPYSIDYHSWLRAHILYQEAQRLANT